MKNNLNKVMSIRVSEEDAELATFYKIDLGAMFRDSLKQALISKKGKCPLCGAKAHWNKSKGSKSA